MTLFTTKCVISLIIKYDRVITCSQLGVHRGARHHYNKLIKKYETSARR